MNKKIVGLAFGLYLLLAGVALYFAFYGCSEVLSRLGNIAIILTLGVLMIYTYYTYILARDTWIPCAAFSLEHITNDSHSKLKFIIHNHSKISLQCYCSLNATVYRVAVDIPGFYSGAKPWDLQPYSTQTGILELGQLLKAAGKTYPDMQAQYSTSVPSEQLNLNIDFWYTPVGTNDHTHNPPQEYYFDFRRQLIVRNV